MARWIAFALFGVTALIVAAVWPLLSDDVVEPWHGYYWNADAQQFEWLAAGSGLTRRDCIETLKAHLRRIPNVSNPIGCAFRGNNFLRVWLTNRLLDETHVRCVTSSAGTGAGARYEALIGTPEQQHARCVGPGFSFFDVPVPRKGHSAASDKADRGGPRRGPGSQP